MTQKIKMEGKRTIATRSKALIDNLEKFSSDEESMEEGFLTISLEIVEPTIFEE
jgi:hypothetical protein